MHPQSQDSAKPASFLYLILKTRMKCYKPKGKLESCCERINSHCDSFCQQSPRTLTERILITCINHAENGEKKGKSPMQEYLYSSFLSLSPVINRLSKFLLQVQVLLFPSYHLAFIPSSKDQRIQFDFCISLPPPTGKSCSWFINPLQTHFILHHLKKKKKLISEILIIK